MTPVPDAKLSLEILIMSAESTFRLPALIVPLETISPDVVTVVPVIAFAVKTEFAMFVIVALSPTCVVFVIAFAVNTEFAILVMVALSKVAF